MGLFLESGHLYSKTLVAGPIMDGTAASGELSGEFISIKMVV